MNLSIANKLREACTWATSNGYVVVKGCWCETIEDKFVKVDPILAYLIKEGLVTSKPEDMRNPGFIELACLHLEVDRSWLYRFFMGYDRNYQILIETKNGDVKDSISQFGIELAHELKGVI